MTEPTEWVLVERASAELWRDYFKAEASKVHSPVQCVEAKHAEAISEILAAPTPPPSTGMEVVRPKVPPVDELATIIYECMTDRSGLSADEIGANPSRLAATKVLERVGEYIEHDIGYLQTNWALASMRADEAESTLAAQARTIEGLRASLDEIVRLSDKRGEELTASESTVIELRAEVERLRLEYGVAPSRC